MHPASQHQVHNGAAPPLILFLEDTIMLYDTVKHCVFYYRYHLVWSTKYRFKVPTGHVRLRVRDICRQVCRENKVDI